MERFLEKVAKTILSEHPDDCAEVLVVFNNHRSQTFLQREFSLISKSDGCQSPFFLPQSMVVDDFISLLGGLKIIPHEFLLFELYRIHVELGGENRKYATFEDFISFGELMISDFSEIDRYCVDARSLFLNLHDLKGIMEWDVEDPNLSEMQIRYLEFYRSLYQYYDVLRTRLFERGEAYGGMAYRYVADNIDSLMSACGYKYVYFVGFNALSECERRIISCFSNLGRGQLIVDGDSYYVDNPEQEAGYFLRKHSSDFPGITQFGPSLFGLSDKHITIVECPENVMQCKFAGQLLSANPNWLSSPESTAIVLADEGLLVPMLNSLPDTDAGVAPYDVNISMGYSFANSKVFDSVLKLFALYEGRNSNGFRQRNIAEFLGDYVFSKIHGISGVGLSFSKWIKESRRVRCKAYDVSQWLESMGVGDGVDSFFSDEELSPDAMLLLLHRFAAMLAESTLAADNKKEFQALGALVEIVDYFTRLQADYKYITRLDTLRLLFVRISSRHSISFLGKPLKGLQIMGVLETRNLDFRRLVILSTNEGVLPAGNTGNTLIPYDLKRHFGLPTYEQRDNVYAYHFYRLLQRADEIYLIYSSDAEIMGKGEPSRFVGQIRRELPAAFPGNVHISDVVVNAQADSRGLDTAISYEKTNDVMSALSAIAESGFSPTALNLYIDCPLSYFFKYVLRLRTDDVEDDMDAALFGENIHAILQQIYEPFIGKCVDAEALRVAKANIESFVESRFQSLSERGMSAEGRNLFLNSVASVQLSEMLTKEIALLDGGTKIEIELLEDSRKKLIATMPSGQSVYLIGQADRIDRITYGSVHNRLRIIDYKTGSVKDDEIALKTKKDGTINLHGKGKWFQLMCYALLYEFDEPVISAIYPLRHTSSGLKIATWDGYPLVDKVALSAFSSILRSLVEEILNPDVPFQASDNPKGCKFCPAARFCPSAKIIDL